MQLATDLRDHGVEAIIDQWHLKEGQDAHSFMEQMVRDEAISKVILVCDEKYVQRANDREGGVGVESQIITNKIYSDVAQTKFVPIVLATADSGDALLPNFLANRIYIDFRNADEYAVGLTKLLRWAFDKPLHLLPEVGKRPEFLDEQIAFRPISNLRMQTAQLKDGDGVTSNFLAFWREARNNHSDFTIELQEEGESDELIANAIDAPPPLLSQMIVSVRDQAERGSLDQIELDEVLRFFEKVFENFEKGRKNWSGDVTKFFAEFILVAVVAILLRCKRFDTLHRLLATPMLKMEHGGVTAKVFSASRIGNHLASLEYRNQRLRLNRASLHADLIKEVCAKTPIEFWEYLQADYYPFLYFDRAGKDERWWPTSNIYVADHYGGFPLFVRATQPELRSALLGPLKLATKSELEEFLEKIREGQYRYMRWQSAFSSLGIWELGNFEAILQSFEE